MIKKLVINLLICCGLFSSNISFAGEKLDQIAAIVGDDIITASELSEKTNLIINSLSKRDISLPSRNVFEHQVLNKIILDRIQLQLAKQLGLEVDSTSVNQAITELANREQLSVADYKKKILQDGMTFEAFREQIKTEIILSKLQQREVANEIKISNADIEGYLNSPEGHDNSHVEYRLGHILLLSPDKPTAKTLAAVEAKAIAITMDLKQGKDFKQLAIANSAGMQALDGGDLGWRTLSKIPTIFVNQVKNMQINDVVGPIQNASGFHIIKLQGKRVGQKEEHIELHVRQILIKPSANTSDQEAKASLLAIRQQIIQGKDFAKLAEKKSEELSTAIKGGDLGWITESAVLLEFWNNVIQLPLLSLSEPFKTELGWHLVQVLERRDSTSSVDAMRHHAAEILRERKFNEVLEIWLKKIRDEAKVEILL